MSFPVFLFLNMWKTVCFLQITLYDHCFSIFWDLQRCPHYTCSQLNDEQILCHAGWILTWRLADISSDLTENNQNLLKKKKKKVLTSKTRCNIKLYFQISYLELGIDLMYSLKLNSKSWFNDVLSLIFHHHWKTKCFFAIAKTHHTTFTMCVTVNTLYHLCMMINMGCGWWQMSVPSETDVKTDARDLKSSHRKFRTDLKRMPCSKDSLMFTETANDTAQCPRATHSNEHQYKGYIFVCQDNQTKVKERESRHLH